jgi:hypothetical protein
MQSKNNKKSRSFLSLGHFRRCLKIYKKPNVPPYNATHVCDTDPLLSSINSISDTYNVLDEVNQDSNSSSITQENPSKPQISD